MKLVECQIQPGLGHQFPGKLGSYYARWLHVMEGRFTPGLVHALSLGQSSEGVKLPVQRAVVNVAHVVIAIQRAGLDHLIGAAALGRALRRQDADVVRSER